MKPLHHLFKSAYSTHLFILPEYTGTTTLKLVLRFRQPRGPMMRCVLLKPQPFTRFVWDAGGHITIIAKGLTIYAQFSYPRMGKNVFRGTFFHLHSYLRVWIAPSIASFYQMVIWNPSPHVCAFRLPLSLPLQSHPQPGRPAGWINAATARWEVGRLGAAADMLLDFAEKARTVGTKELAGMTNRLSYCTNRVWYCKDDDENVDEDDDDDDCTHYHVRIDSSNSTKYAGFISIHGMLSRINRYHELQLLFLYYSACTQVPPSPGGPHCSSRARLRRFRRRF